VAADVGRDPFPQFLVRQCADTGGPAVLHIVGFFADLRGHHAAKAA